MTSTSAPNRVARVLAVLAIALAGLCGGLIGYVATDLQCSNGCSTTAGFIGVLSAVGAAVGVAVVVTLTLRASAEWQHRERNHLPQ